MTKARINLGTIRGFDSAARHLSFTLAADELGVTQGAISRQVALLEHDIGVVLFKRMTRRLALTQAGAEFHEAVRAALYVLDRGAASVRTVKPSQAITVSVLPTVGTVWLMPRLHRFMRAHPAIDVRVVTSIDPANLTMGQVDVAIRVGALPSQTADVDAPRIDLKMVTDWTDIEVHDLFPDILVPVMSARLQRTNAHLPLRQLLATSPLIHTSTRRYGWPDWLAAQRMPQSTDKGFEFGHFFMALEEARAGRGIALVPNVLLPDLEYLRQLHVIKAKAIESAGSYRALTRRDAANDQRIVLFLSWLKKEAADLRRKIARR